MANPNQPDQPKGVQSSQGGRQQRSGGDSSGGQGNYSFRCADMGNTSCSWEARGSSQDEVLRKAEQHGREPNRSPFFSLSLLSLSESGASVIGFLLS